MCIRRLRACIGTLRLMHATQCHAVLTSGLHSNPGRTEALAASAQAGCCNAAFGRQQDMSLLAVSMGCVTRDQSVYIVLSSICHVLQGGVQHVLVVQCPCGPYHQDGTQTRQLAVHGFIVIQYCPAMCPAYRTVVGHCQMIDIMLPSR